MNKRFQERDFDNHYDVKMYLYSNEMENEVRNKQVLPPIADYFMIGTIEDGKFTGIINDDCGGSTDQHYFLRGIDLSTIDFADIGYDLSIDMKGIDEDFYERDIIAREFPELLDEIDRIIDEYFIYDEIDNLYRILNVSLYTKQCDYGYSFNDEIEHPIKIGNTSFHNANTDHITNFDIKKFFYTTRKDENVVEYYQVGIENEYGFTGVVQCCTGNGGFSKDYLILDGKIIGYDMDNNSYLDPLINQIEQKYKDVITDIFTEINRFFIYDDEDNVCRFQGIAKGLGNLHQNGTYVYCKEIQLPFMIADIRFKV